MSGQGIRPFVKQEALARFFYGIATHREAIPIEHPRKSLYYSGAIPWPNIKVDACPRHGLRRARCEVCK